MPGAFLKPGGRIRTLAPDLNAIIREYLGQHHLPADEYPDDPARRLCARLLMRDQYVQRRGLLYSIYAGRTDFNSHKWMYDGPSLVKLMTEAGFVDCQEKGFRDSAIPHIDLVESQNRFTDGTVVEGRKN